MKPSCEEQGQELLAMVVVASEMVALMVSIASSTQALIGGVNRAFALDDDCIQISRKAMLPVPAAGLSWPPDRCEELFEQAEKELVAIMNIAIRQSEE
jgi:hypothetical protein